MKRIKYFKFLYSQYLKVYWVIFCFYTSVNLLNSQVLFDFEKKDITGWEQQMPHKWECSSEAPLSGSFSLKHVFNNPSEGDDGISFKFPDFFSRNDTIHWSFKIRHAYNPSSANNWAVFLASDKSYTEMNPRGSSSALIFGVNYTGSADIPGFWMQNENGIKLIAESDLNWETSIKDSIAAIDIVRTPKGEWLFKIFNVKGSLLTEFSMDSMLWFPEAKYMGVYYKYSSSQDMKLWIDDISIKGSIFQDTIKPHIDTFYLASTRKLRINFSEPINLDAVSVLNFNIDNKLIVKSVKPLINNGLEINFEHEVENELFYHLKISAIEDLKGNQIIDSTIVFNYHYPNLFDILFTEIMADPEPTVNLPPSEYLELYNNSNFAIDLLGWNIETPQNAYILPNMILNPKQYVCIVNEDNKGNFEDSIPVLEGFHSKYSLSNEANFIVLKDSSKKIISFANYSPELYDAFKENGGWSLEMVDYNNPCNAENWKPSLSINGGTPGKPNSVSGINKDVNSPVLKEVRVISDTSLMVEFSEFLKPDQLFKVGNYVCDNGIGVPNSVNYENGFSSVRLNFNKKFEISTIYTLELNNELCDCVGNKLTKYKLKFARPVPPDSLDIVINEVLFDAYPGGSKFMEILNRSTKVVDAGKISLVVYDTLSNQIKGVSRLAKEGTFLFPGCFLATAESYEKLEKYYLLKKPENIVENSSFPTLSDHYGKIALMSLSGKIIDKFSYSYKLHSAFLNSTEGVSLERVSSEVSSEITYNWRSAAQVAGYATPGYENSGSSLDIKPGEEITISPEVFSPNSDGRDDVVGIKIPEVSSSAMLKIQVFNASGKLVRNLVSSQTTNGGIVIPWDGSSDDGSIQPSGIYVIYIAIFSDDGKSRELKKVCVLSKK